MLAAIYFYYQLFIKTYHINDVTTDSMLSTEFESFQLPVL